MGAVRGENSTTQRFCVCGHAFDPERPETREHDHAARILESQLRSVDALAFSLHEAEVDRWA